MPDLPTLFSHDKIARFCQEMKALQLNIFQDALVVNSNTTRFPIKPRPGNAIEERHLKLSSDGLRFFPTFINHYLAGTSTQWAYTRKTANLKLAY